MTVASATPDTPSLYRLRVARGRFLDTGDLDDRRHTCVLGHEVAEELFQGRNALGEPLRIDGDVWRVVGVLANKPMLGSTDATWIWNRKVLVPETSFDATYNSGHAAERLIVRPRAGGRSGEWLATLRRLIGVSLGRRHFGVQNFDLTPSHDGDQAELILTILRVLLFGATLISLFVSGINVMNVMLVSVSERTVEIGIRRALGASPRAIRRQFLCEALVLTGIGGITGVSLGAGLAYTSALVLRRVLGAWELHVEPWAMALGLFSSLLIGLIFGMYPALRAARLDVVEALRNE